jgi:hypothetical protein
MSLLGKLGLWNDAEVEENVEKMQVMKKKMPKKHQFL